MLGIVVNNTMVTLAKNKYILMTASKAFPSQKMPITDMNSETFIIRVIALKSDN